MFRRENAKRIVRLLLGLTTFCMMTVLCGQESASPPDLSPHQVQSISVDKNVDLEVLNWGGSGRALILLAGLGATAHDFDVFAPKLADWCHVYGITRRGFGASSQPKPVYSADRLGDDVLAVMESLKLIRPVLVGHSVGGEELSSVASRHPEKIAGVVYLDAAYSYAYYDASLGDPWIDSVELRKKLERLIPGRAPKGYPQVVEDILDSLPRFEGRMRQWHQYLEVMPALPVEVLPSLTPGQAIIEGAQKYTSIRVPALAIYAIPKDLGPAFGNNQAARAAADAAQLAFDGAQAEVFKKGVPGARVVILPNASHFIYQSNEVDVLREMRAFLTSVE